MNYLIAFALIAAGLSGCAPAKVEVKKAVYDGQNHFAATKDQIIAKLQQDGLLESVQTSSLDRSYDVVSSKGDTQYFTKDGKVVSYIRRPAGDETRLIYWRYKFQGQLYRDQELMSDGKLGHRVPMRELACDSCDIAGVEAGKGIGVVYDPSSETVKGVFFYDHP